MKAIPLKPKIRSAIIALFKSFIPGETINSYFIVKHVHRYVSKFIKDGSIDRYMRELKEEGLISYECPIRCTGDLVIGKTI